MTDRDIDRQTYLGVGAAIILGIMIMLLAMSYARSEPYVRIDGAISSAHSMQGYDLKTAPAIEGGIGYRWHNNFRSDITLGYRSYKLTGTVSGLSADSRVSSLTALFNAYFDIGQIGILTPYIGAGVGMSWNGVSETSLASGAARLSSGSKTSLAWQVSAGVGIALAQNWTLDVGYRYMDMGTATTGDNLAIGGAVIPGFATSSRFTAHEGRLGVRYNF